MAFPRLLHVFNRIEIARFSRKGAETLSTNIGPAAQH